MYILPNIMETSNLGSYTQSLHIEHVNTSSSKMTKNLKINKPLIYFLLINCNTTRDYI